MPRMPADPEQLAGFTEMYVADLARRDKRVGAFLEQD